MLHLIAEAALSEAVVERIAACDDVVLQGGVVWAAFSGHHGNTRITQLLARDCRLYVLSDMLAKHGIGHQQVLAGVEIIDYSALVDLTVKNPVIHTWR